MNVVLTNDQAELNLVILGEITDKKEVQDKKLCFSNTAIAWMTSSSTVRTIWSSLYAVGLSGGWNCDTGMLPKLTGRISEVIGEKISQLESADQIDITAMLVQNAIVGLGFLRDVHYEGNSRKSIQKDNVNTAMDTLTKLFELADSKSRELASPKETVNEIPMLTPMESLKQLYDNLGKKFVDLNAKVQQASQQKENFKGVQAFSIYLQEPNADGMDKVPAEISDDPEFNKLREKYIKRITLYNRLEVEAKGWNVSLSE